MVYLPMKRSSESELDSAITSMANCLMMLSRVPTSNDPYDQTDLPTRVFECKTCNRQFPSFQALGGHRASHKKPRVHGELTQGTNSVSTKPKSHECSICGLEFAIGQALVGHMRRHRVTTTIENQSSESSGRIVKKVISRRVFSLDLNLTPLENDLEFRSGKTVPTTIELFL